MSFFLYHRSSRPTGHVIAEALGFNHGENVPGHEQIDALIRWGSRRTDNAYHGNVTRTVNRPDALGKASDKLGTLRVLRAAGVRVPDFSENPEDLSYPFLGRRTQHARGTDVVLCLQRGDIERRPRDYYVQYIPTKREFRVHVVDGRVIRVQGKFLDRPEEAVAWIRNYKHGYRFRAPRRNLNSSRLSAATNAVAALGLDFGAVDLLIGDDNLEYVLEVNTAPACSPITAKAYVDAFTRMLSIPSTQLRLDALRRLSTDEEDAIETEDEVSTEADTVQQNAPALFRNDTRLCSRCGYVGPCTICPRCVHPTERM